MIPFNWDVFLFHSSVAVINNPVSTASHDPWHIRPNTLLETASMHGLLVPRRASSLPSGLRSAIRARSDPWHTYVTTTWLSELNRSLRPQSEHWSSVGTLSDHTRCVAWPSPALVQKQASVPCPTREDSHQSNGLWASKVDYSQHNLIKKQLKGCWLAATQPMIPYNLKLVWVSLWIDSTLSNFLFLMKK